MLQKKHHSSLCFSGDPNFTSERVIQPSSLGAERAGNRGILDESTFSEGVCVQTHKLHREISKESQGVGDLFTATSYVKSKSVLLATAICFIRDSFGKMQENTVFGYIASGSIPVSSENKPHCGLIKDNVDLEKTMRRFWEIENVEPETIKNKETIICQSKDIALKKLNSLWNRLKREPNYLKLYRDFLKEYKELGHMQEVDEREECGMYFIPHLGVYRSDKKTSKLRVVFNASSATTNGYSLNSLQYNGGVAQNDLFSIMVRFRKHIFAFIADVQKMYRMIWINPDQRKLQRILWRENMDEPIKTFELSTVTYGTTSAPFLATRTLKQLALDEAGNFPLGSSVVMSDMYIDDVLTGAETLLEAKELKNQLINIFAKGGMVLHKWCGNNTELIEVSENYDFSDSSEIKVLGVYWNPKHDCFSFRVKIDLHELNTKRDVLSTIARIYDPLGLLGPVVAKAKIFLQKLWMLKIDWTDLLPDTINREWRQFVESLQVVNDININRCIVVEQPEVIELHGFSDASQSAYGAVVYCKSITSDGKMLVHLIASKSRVAPTKQTTIPRLELCAAVLLAKLVHRVKQALKLNVTNTFLE
ncbi:integrase catalytic domain-containing protein [Trichonephila clavipes]|nr:integrase catalytic domain-containing protein [Trichonephila clavipes]